MTGQAAGGIWPSACPPPATPVLSWDLHDVADLPRVRAELRRRAADTDRTTGHRSEDHRDQLLLALDEMASNALRHGGGEVHAVVRLTGDSYVIEVSDQAVSAPPAPAVGRDPSQGGLGLYLIAELATDHGWYVRDGQKHVWARLPRA